MFTLKSRRLNPEDTLRCETEPGRYGERERNRRLEDAKLENGNNEHEEINVPYQVSRIEYPASLFMRE